MKAQDHLRHLHILVCAMTGCVELTERGLTPEERAAIKDSFEAVHARLNL